MSIPPPPAPFRLFRHAAAVIVLCAVPLAAGSAPAPSAAPARSNSVSPADDAPDLQELLHATREEWSIIGPKLDQIAALREALAVTAATPPPPARTTRRFLDSPMGGTSLDAPVMNGRMGAGRTNPFDPAKAPGTHPPTILGALVGALGHAVVHNFRPDQGNMLQTELTDLDNLLKDKDTTDAQLRDKLAEVRAARAKTVRQLAAAQKDLMPLLTTEQQATLVAMGYLD